MKEPKFNPGDRVYWKSLREPVDIVEVHYAYVVKRRCGGRYEGVKVPMLHEDVLEHFDDLEHSIRADERGRIAKSLKEIPCRTDFEYLGKLSAFIEELEQG